MTWKLLSLIAAAVFALLGALVIFMISGTAGRPASEWQTEKWMQPDGALPVPLPARVLSLTDLPPLKVTPAPKDFLAAIAQSKEALADLEGAITLNRGRVFYLGIQILNTTVKDLPADLP